MLDEEVSSAASDEGSCDPNYKGECLDPDAIDYDCAAGEGDGPEYARPVEVVGTSPTGSTPTETASHASNPSACSVGRGS
jgi:hypothetical protein